MTSRRSSNSTVTLAAYLAAASFGFFWGTWGASVPRIRLQAGIDDGQLGLALLFIGAGALPAMLLTGRALDRWGLRFAVLTVVSLGVCGLGMALTAHSYAILCAGLVVVGLASGAADVAMNSLAGRAEQATGTPILLRSGGVFSTSVVLSSGVTGLAAWLAAPLFIPFAIVAALSVVASAFVLGALTRFDGAAPPATVRGLQTDAPALAARIRLLPLLLVGALGALAFASENAHQSWGAVFLEDELDAGSGLSAVAPAVFAGVVALTRFSLGRMRQGNEVRLLLAGSATAAGGAVILAASPTIPFAIAGLVVAAAGTAALYPLLLSLVSRGVTETHRGRATSLVTTIAYLGFILGPVYVGAWSNVVGLRGAFAAIAGLGLVLVLVASPLLRASGFVTRRDSESHRAHPTPTTCNSAICNSRRGT
jgi:MFS family permease